jgi:hypothetical protein
MPDRRRWRREFLERLAGLRLHKQRAAVLDVLGEVRVLEQGALRNEVHLAAEMSLEILLEAEVAVEKLRGIPLLERHDEVQVAVFGIEPVTRSRAEEVKPLYAVLLAERCDLRPPVLDNADHASTLPRMRYQATGVRFQVSGFSSSPLPSVPPPLPSFPRKRESTAADATHLDPEPIYPITYQPSQEKAALLSKETVPCNTESGRRVVRFASPRTSALPLAALKDVDSRFRGNDASEVYPMAIRRTWYKS